MTKETIVIFQTLIVKFRPYGVYISQLIRISRSCSLYSNFLYHRFQSSKLLSQGFLMIFEESSLFIFQNVSEYQTIKLRQKRFFLKILTHYS